MHTFALDIGLSAARHLNRYPASSQPAHHYIIRGRPQVRRGSNTDRGAFYVSLSWHLKAILRASDESVA